jgi:hypothetical protein
VLLEEAHGAQQCNTRLRSPSDTFPTSHSAAPSSTASGAADRARCALPDPNATTLTAVRTLYACSPP